MNSLETNLILWAICSIILCEILIILSLFRLCFNRVKAKKFYVKKEEYEYLEETPALLRPPAHTDELAGIGTIRSAGVDNFAFYRDPDESRSTPHWIELQPTMIPSADYEIHSDDYLSPQSLHSEDRWSHFRFQPLRRPELYLSPIQRLDTSTESPAINYANIVPKSILKGSPPSHLRSSRSPSKYDESPRTSVRIKIEPSVFDDSLDEPQDDSRATQQNHRHVSRVFVPWEDNRRSEAIFLDPDTERQALEY